MACLALLAVTPACALGPAFQGCGNPLRLGPDDCSPLADGRVIYGDDNRLEAYQARPEARAVVASTPAFFRSRDLILYGDAYSVPQQSRYTQVPGDQEPLCPDEPFYNQPAGAWCTGFVVGPDLVATAAHCIDPTRLGSLVAGADCSAISLVFGYQVEATGGVPREIPADQVYRCKSLLAGYRDRASGEAWALVRVDRPFGANHPPLAIRRDGEMPVGTDLTVVGYPSGLPVKLAGGATLRGGTPVSFTTDLDSYAGNSGSPVFATASLLAGRPLVEAAILNVEHKSRQLGIEVAVARSREGQC